MALGHNGPVTQWDMDINGTVTQWDRDISGTGTHWDRDINGTVTQWDRDISGPGTRCYRDINRPGTQLERRDINGIGTLWDWDTTDLVHNGTRTSAGLTRNGTGTQENGKNTVEPRHDGTGTQWSYHTMGRALTLQDWVGVVQLPPWSFHLPISASHRGAAAVPLAESEEGSRKDAGHGMSTSQQPH